MQLISSETMHLLLKMKLIGESVKGKPNGCLVDELGALDCRAGCPICSFNEKLENILNYFPNKEEGPGRWPNKTIITLTMSFRPQKSSGQTCLGPA